MFSSLPKLDPTTGFQASPYQSALDILADMGNHLASGSSPNPMNYMSFAYGMAVWIAPAILMFLIFLLWAPCFTLLQCCKCCCCSYRQPCCCCRCCCWRKGAPNCRICTRIFFVIFVVLTCLAIATAFVGNAMVSLSIDGAKSGVDNGFGFAGEVFSLKNDIQGVGDDIVSTVNGLVELVMVPIGSRGTLNEKLLCIINGLNTVPDFSPLVAELNKVATFKSDLPSKAFVDSQIDDLQSALTDLARLPFLLDEIDALVASQANLPSDADLDTLNTVLKAGIDVFPEISVDIAPDYHAYTDAYEAYTPLATFSSDISTFATDSASLSTAADTLSTGLSDMDTQFTSLADTYGLVMTNPDPPLIPGIEGKANVITAADELAAAITDYANADPLDDATINSKIDAMMTAVGTFSDIDLTHSKLLSLQTLQGTLPALVTANKNGLAAVGTAVSALKTKVDALKTKVDGFESNTADVLAKVDPAVTALQTLVDAIAALGTMSIHVTNSALIHEAKVGAEGASTVKTDFNTVYTAASFDFGPLLANLATITNGFASMPNLTVIQDTLTQAAAVLSAIDCVQYFVALANDINSTLIELPASIGDSLVQASELTSVDIPDFTGTQAQIQDAEAMLDNLPDFTQMTADVQAISDSLAAATASINPTDYNDGLQNVIDAVAAMPDTLALKNAVKTLSDTLGALPDFSAMITKIGDVKTALNGRPNFAGLSTSLGTLSSALALPADATTIKNSLADLSTNLASWPSISTYVSWIGQIRTAVNLLSTNHVNAKSEVTADKAKAVPRTMSLIANTFFANSANVKTYITAAAPSRHTTLYNALNGAKTIIDAMPSRSSTITALDDMVTEIGNLPTLPDFTAAVNDLKAKGDAVIVVSNAQFDGLTAALTGVTDASPETVVPAAKGLRTTFNAVPDSSAMRSSFGDAQSSIDNVPNLDEAKASTHFLDEAQTSLPSMDGVLAQIDAFDANLQSADLPTIRSQIQSVRDQLLSVVDLMSDTSLAISNMIRGYINGAVSMIEGAEAQVDSYNQSIASIWQYPKQYDEYRLWGTVGFLILLILALFFAVLTAFVCRKSGCICCGSCCLLWLNILIFLFAFLFQALGWPSSAVCHVIRDPGLPEVIAPLVNGMGMDIHMSFELAPLSAAQSNRLVSPEMEYLAQVVADRAGIAKATVISFLSMPVRDFFAMMAPNAEPLTVSIDLVLMDLVTYYLSCEGTDPLAALFAQKPALLEFALSFTQIARFLPAGWNPRQGLLDAAAQMGEIVNDVGGVVDTVQNLTSCTRLNTVVFGLIDPVCVTLVNGLVLMWMGFFLTGCCVCPTLCCMMYSRPIWPKWRPETEKHIYPRGWKGIRAGANDAPVPQDPKSIEMKDRRPADIPLQPAALPPPPHSPRGKETYAAPIPADPYYPPPNYPPPPPANYPEAHYPPASYPYGYDTAPAPAYPPPSQYTYPPGASQF